MKILASILKTIIFWYRSIVVRLNSLDIKTRLEENGSILRLIEVITVVVGVIVALGSISQVKTQISQTNTQINQIQTQINQGTSGINLVLEQNQISKNAYEKGKRFEEIKLLQETSQYFEIEPNRSILEYMRTKNSEKLSGYGDFAIVELLNKFEYLARLWEENEFKENDIRVNFASSIEVICENRFATGPEGIMNKYAPDGFGGVKKLCHKRGGRN